MILDITGSIESIDQLINLESRLRKRLMSQAGIKETTAFNPFCILKQKSLNYDATEIDADLERLNLLNRSQIIMDDHHLLDWIATMEHLKTSDGEPFFSDFPSPVSTRPDPAYLQILSEGLSLVRESGEYYRKILDGFLTQIVPLEESKKVLGRGGSLTPLRGVVFLGATSSPGSEVFSAATGIIHELFHNIVSLLNSSDPLVGCDPGLPVYSAIRGEKRPAILTYHAMVVLTAMTRFIRHSDTKGRMPTKFLDAAKQVREMALKTMNEVSKIPLTETGALLMQNCRQHMAEI